MKVDSKHRFQFKILMDTMKRKYHKIIVERYMDEPDGNRFKSRKRIVRQSGKISDPRAI